MKVLLVRTRAQDRMEPYGVFPLGLMYLAAVLRKDLSAQVRIVDMQADLLDPEDVLREAQGFCPDYIGLSGFSLEKSIITATARVLKSGFPDGRVILGGPHASASRAAALACPDIDIAVIGEGEQTVPDLLRALESGADLATVNGIVFRRGREIVANPEREFIRDLDELPFPAWDLIDLPKYYRLPRFMPFVPDKAVPYMTILSSRGCPYRCIYCHCIMGKIFRKRSARNVFEEMEFLHRHYGIGEFDFVDDCFNLDKARVIELCRLIVESGLRFRISFPNGLRGDQLNEEVLRHLKAAGTVEISFAPETGSSRLQRLIRKNVDLPRLQEVIRTAARMGIHAHGFFMIGFPTETQEDLAMTRSFMKRSRLHTMDVFVVNAFAHTELSEMAARSEQDRVRTHAPVDFHNTRENLSEVADEVVFRFKKDLFLQFYLNPVRAWRLLNSPVLKKRYFFYYVKLFLWRVLLNKRCS